MSLRSRLLLVVVGLTVAGLAALGIVTYTSERSFLLGRVDRTLDASTHAVAPAIDRSGGLGPGELRQLAAANPGLYIGYIPPHGSVAWQPINVPPGHVPTPAPRPVDAGTQQQLTVGAVSGSTHYRVQLQPLLISGGTLALAAPLADVEASLRHLLLIEVIVSLCAVAAIVALGLWLIRVGLAPLRRIEADAAAIGAGDLARRLEDHGERTEIGRLAGALNAMLGQIERAFAQRAASERRLRRFVADASHELRTPLSAVRAYAELFGRGARDRPDDLARAMAGIEREAGRMGLLVDDLLLLARLDQGRPLRHEPVALDEVAHTAVEAARAVDPSRALALDAAPVVVMGDGERLRQVVDNLLSNVRAHTPAGTAATVRVSELDDGRAALEVADEGPGLSAEESAHAFERFYRGDPVRSGRDGRGGGTGLGLAIVRAIARAHGGDVEYVERATFRVTLTAGAQAPSRPL